VGTDVVSQALDQPEVPAVTDPKDRDASPSEPPTEQSDDAVTRPVDSAPPETPATRRTDEAEPSEAPTIKDPEEPAAEDEAGSSDAPTIKDPEGPAPGAGQTEIDPAADAGGAADDDAEGKPGHTVAGDGAPGGVGPTLISEEGDEAAPPAAAPAPVAAQPPAAAAPPAAQPAAEPERTGSPGMQTLIGLAAGLAAALLVWAVWPSGDDDAETDDLFAPVAAEDAAAQDDEDAGAVPALGRDDEPGDMAARDPDDRPADSTEPPGSATSTATATASTTGRPSVLPTAWPTGLPTGWPTAVPTVLPTALPGWPPQPTAAPTTSGAAPSGSAP
jgi:hypothetical protein